MYNNTNKIKMVNPSKVSLIAFTFGILSIVCSLIIGNAAFQSSVNDFEQQYRKFYLREAKLFVKAAEVYRFNDDETLLNSIQSLWNASTVKAADEYICIVDKDSNLIMHTAHPETIGNFAGSNLINREINTYETSLADLVKSQRDYVGDYISSTGQNQLAAFASIPDKRWVIGVHRSKQELMGEIEEGMRFSKIGFYLISALLMPLSWVLIYLTFQKAERKRKLAEEALKDSEDKLIEAQQLAKIGYYDFDIKTGYWTNSAELDDIFGINEKFTKNITGWQQIIHPDSREKMLNYLQDNILSQHQKFDIEYNIISIRTGQEKWVHGLGSLIFDENGNPVKMFGTIQDITERKQAEGALRESEKRFRDISHSLADWIWEVDKNGKYTYVSDTVEKILGYSPEELKGKTPFELMNAEEAVKISEIFLEIASKSRPIVDLENWNIDKCGSEVCLLTNGVPILDADGELLGYRGVNKDITSQKKLEAEKTAIETRLQQAQKMESIGTLAGGIAHDFNNILGAILGYAQLAGMDLSENSKSHRHIEQILKASDRAKSLVGQILAFSRENKLEKFPVDIGIIVKEALKLLRASLPANIEIRQNVTSNLGTVMADQTQVHQIMMNLCTNALHAMERNGGLLEVVLVPVELKEEDAAAYPDIKPDRYLKLSVTDSGHGMDSATVSRIFDPYFTTKDIDEGTGLGLATVHGIVKGHGGIIKVYSEPGSGTSFQIYLPCIEDNVITEEKVSKPLSTGTEQILFLDDDKVLADIGEKMLKKLGYRVNSRTSPYEALEAFKANPSKYDMVITDMTMPGMTGDILAKEILKIRYNIPIIICTGFSKMMSPEKASKMGIKDFLMKPLTMSDLSKSIRTVLDQN